MKVQFLSNRATCSGKTSLAQHLQKEFPHTVLINQDRFYLVSVPVYVACDVEFRLTNV